MTRVLVTGAGGFVGSSLCEVLTRANYRVRAAVRSGTTSISAPETIAVGDIGATTDWAAALEGVDIVVHAAARVHQAHDTAADSDRYMETNVRGTQRLAAAAAQAHVGRFIYLSSVKVNGERTHAVAYTARDEPHPEDAYGLSKRMAEISLAEAAGGAMETVIVRPPLVYGPRVRANFLRLLRWVDRGLPLPLGALHNRRSLVSIWNLCDLLCRLLTHPRAAGRVWMVSDGQDLSTPELIRLIGKAMGRDVRLPPVPVAALRLVGRLTGRAAEVDRLCGSLAVDISDTRQYLEWTPPITVEAAIARTVEWYAAESRVHAR